MQLEYYENDNDKINVQSTSHKKESNINNNNEVLVEKSAVQKQKVQQSDDVHDNKLAALLTQKSQT